MSYLLKLYNHFFEKQNSVSKIIILHFRFIFSTFTTIFNIPYINLIVKYN